VTLGRRPRPTRELSWVRGAPADAGSFGAVIAEPSATYRPGQAVEAVFVSALPNNDLRRGGTYLEVVRREGASWVRIADDGDWATSFRWQRQGRAGSHVSIRWDVPGDTTPGQYRIVHHGTARDRNGMLTAFSATTREFTVV
ncbi:neutral/alkaline non-lysosomal ceramidase C-terminal domain-containing protein, partial [Mycobacterium tuberculosis]